MISSLGSGPDFSVEGLSQGRGTHLLRLAGESEDDDYQKVGEHDQELVWEIDAKTLNCQL